MLHIDFTVCMFWFSYYLAMKKSPDKIQTLRLVYEDELQRALTEDGQKFLYIFHHKVTLEMELHNGIC